MKVRILLALVVVGTLLTGCKTTKYVPVETVKTEYRDREVERLSTDTVTDTRFIFVKGDTVVDYRERTKTRIVEVRDTATVVKTDSVAVPYPVERKLTRWERTKMDYGGWAIGAVMAIIAAAVVWLRLRQKNKRDS